MPATTRPSRRRVKPEGETDLSAPTTLRQARRRANSDADAELGSPTTTRSTRRKAQADAVIDAPEASRPTRRRTKPAVDSIDVAVEPEAGTIETQNLAEVAPVVVDLENRADDLDDDVEIITPDLPPGRDIELPGRGKTFIRELPGPPGAPTLILLHGWTATSDLNWFTCYHKLGETCRVVALDHRGHGNGIRSRKRFKLADCADDVMALADELGIDQFIPVGYSMGGTVAQLIAHKYPERVRGLVLCSTAGWFTSKRSDRLPFLSMAGLAALARVTSPQLQGRITQQMYLDKKTDKWDPWAVEQVSKHDWRMVLEAGQAIGAFTSREWLNELDMPTSILMTIDDHVIPIRRQMALFERIRNAEAYRINGDHDAVAALAETYVPLLSRAIASVIDRTSV